jgi:mono/diheme cytochrome c family protein
MNRARFWSLSLLGALLVAGCGGGGQSGSSNSDASAALSPYDGGPRAGEAPVVAAQIPVGEKLFKVKGCSACHAFGKRLTCPDLRGVTMRRTASWMEHQILHPEIMTKEDPISRKLLAEYAQQMPNQGLTQDEARSVIEFFKHNDEEAGLTPE